MTTASLNTQALAVLATLHNALLHCGEITIRSTDLGRETRGVAAFKSNTVHVNPHQGLEQWRSTLAHELLHLLRGPAGRHGIAAEEDTIEQLVAGMFLPAGELARRHWSPESREILADHYEVDIDTLHAALNPPTQPMRRVPRHGLN